MSDDAAKLLKNRNWRLNNLYWVTDKDGKKVQFHPNKEQDYLFKRLTKKTLILKGRQLGITTGFCILWLDLCLFHPNTKVGIIAHTKDDAKKIFREKVKFAYDNLPPDLRAAVGLEKLDTEEIIFGNGSSIRVSVSFRSGTVQVLHITEFGVVCAKEPQRAEEIVTGAIPAVPKDGYIVVESTAKGMGGYFYDWVMEAQKNSESGYGWKLHFLPWWDHEEYSTDRIIKLYEHEEQYILDVQKKINRVITPQQASWWAMNYRLQGQKMLSEYPSVPEDAFKQSVEGAYYKTQMLDAWHQKRVVDMPIEPGLAVDTWWDLGMADAMAIVFVQRFGGWINVIDYYENTGEGLAHYVDYLHKWREKNKVIFGRHVGPHDLGVRELGTGETRLERARQLGIVFDVAPRLNLDDGIEAVRNLLPKCRFDAIRCEKLVKSLETYRKEWDDRLGRWKDKPFHGPESHAADAVRYGATVFGRMQRAGAPAIQREVKKIRWTL